MAKKNTTTKTESVDAAIFSGNFRDESAKQAADAQRQAMLEQAKGEHVNPMPAEPAPDAAEPAPDAEPAVKKTRKTRDMSGEANILPNGERRVTCAIPEAAYQKLLRTADGRSIAIWGARLILRALAREAEPEDELFNFENPKAGEK